MIKNITTDFTNTASLLLCATLPFVSGCDECPEVREVRLNLESGTDRASSVAKITPVNDNTNVLIFPARRFPEALEHEMSQRKNQRLVVALPHSTQTHGDVTSFLVVFEEREKLKTSATSRVERDEK